MAVSQASVFKI